MVPNYHLICGFSKVFVDI